MNRHPRPATGTVTIKEIRVPICMQCGCIIDIGLCTDSCPLDGGSHTGNTLVAVYERSDKFLRDEKSAEHPAPASAPAVASAPGEKCGLCHGSGIRNYWTDQERDCPDCGGTGEKPHD